MFGIFPNLKERFISWEPLIAFVYLWHLPPYVFELVLKAAYFQALSHSHYSASCKMGLAAFSYNALFNYVPTLGSMEDLSGKMGYLLKQGCSHMIHHCSFSHILDGKQPWGLVLNNQEIVHSLSRVGAVSSSLLLTTGMTTKWWDKKLPAVARKRFSWAKRE